MSPEALGHLSDNLAWMAVLAYLFAAVLFGFELAYRVAWVGRAGVAVALAGLGANVATAVTRGLAAHRVPWGNMYEYSVMVGIIMVSAFLVWLRRKPEVRPLGVFVLLPAVLVIAVAGVALYTPAGPLMPALNSGWLKIHVVAAILGSSILCLASVFSILYLVRDHFERRAAAPRPPLVAGAARTADRVEVREAIASYVEEAEERAEPAAPSTARISGRLPSAKTLDDLAYKTAAFGFPIWTFAVIAGAIWAQSAWGRYWGWDPKETWAFITWVVFASYLHARATAGWRGRGAAWISIAGLIALIFNFYAVNLWIVGLHSYAGV